MDSRTITREQLAGMFDHTNLKAYATDEDFVKLCAEAKANGYAMVAINPSPVKLCRQLLEGTPVHVGAAMIDAGAERIGSEERRVAYEGASMCRSGWAPEH